VGHVNHEEVKEMAAKVEDRLGKLIKETILGMRRHVAEAQKK
jgi:hypothetical protein